MLEKNADVNCCFLCSVIFIEYYSTMHCNEVLQACQVDPIYCDIFGAAERVLRYGLPINLRYIFKRVPTLVPPARLDPQSVLGPINQDLSHCVAKSNSPLHRNPICLNLRAFGVHNAAKCEVWRQIHASFDPKS